MTLCFCKIALNCYASKRTNTEMEQFSDVAAMISRDNTETMKQRHSLLLVNHGTQL